MPNTITQKLKQTLRRIELEQDELARQAEHFRKVIDYYESQEDSADLELSSVKTMRNEMFRILESAGAPLHYRDIYQKLRRRGVSVGGESPEKNVGAHLSADSRFEPLGKGNWGLKSWRAERRTEIPSLESETRSPFAVTVEGAVSDEDRANLGDLAARLSSLPRN